jgi:LysR family transcriptional regulator, glycine cleavage system transcriptional activator
MNRLPSLNQIKAFEAAGRLLSIQNAADELSVTPAAISRQVRALEEHLGKQLFIRDHRAIRLTADGVRYLREITEGLDIIRRATLNLTKKSERRVLKIQAYTTFSMKWLIPRLSSFHSKNPDIDVRITTSLAPANFKRDGIDAAVRLGLDATPGLAADWLVPNELVPVCSSAFLKQHPALANPTNLGQATLLHSLARPDDWAKWLRAAGIGTVDGYAGLKYESSVMIYQAAIEGHGIAIAQRILVSDDLASGRLVMPYQFVLDEGAFTYYLVYPQTKVRTPEFETFREWLKSLAHP